MLFRNVTASKRFSLLSLLALVLVALSSSPALAELQLARLFSDHMVLQRNMPLPVWGWADPGEEITVTIDSQTKTGRADAAGKWLVKLEPMDTGDPRTLKVAGRTKTLQINDVLLGEVWICAGQSNMEWPLEVAQNGAAEIAAANHSQIRLFQVGNEVTPAGPVERLEASAREKCVWRPCTPESAKPFSAVGYFFGRDLHKKLQVPVGLISNAVGATLIEAWISRDAMLADADAKFLVERSDRILAFAKSPQGKSELDAVLAEYDAKQKVALAQGKWFWRSDDYQEPQKQLRYPGTFFNGRVNPLMPYAIRGVIWYQGEGNWDMAYAYRNMLPLLIKDWRARWGQGDFPFLFVQLPNFGNVSKDPQPGEWCELRESQLRTLSLPNTAMAVAIDIGDAHDIHPKNKQDVGARLALAARGIAYKEAIEYSGPIYRGMKIEGASVRLSFDHCGGGLVARNGELQQFAIAGDDKKFVWAKAKIDGDTVIVQADGVAAPVAVRYAWTTNPQGCNLYNGEGLPASPFRTDDWPSPSSAKSYKSELDKPISFKLKN